MILINLLPVRHLKKRAKTQLEVCVVCAAFVVLCSVLLGATFLMSMNVKQMQGEVTRLQAKKRSYDSKIQEIKRIEEQKKALFVKIEAIKNLKAHSQVAVHVLDEVAVATPPNAIWLKSYNQKETSMDLTAMALDNTSVADYMLALEKSVYIVSAKLKQSARTVVASRDLKTFALSLTLSPPKESHDGMEVAK